MELGRFSVGIGDRFGMQGRAQLRAVVRAAEAGFAVTPVWNKSHREHSIIGTLPDSVRMEAEEAVAEIGWQGDYFVDADHITRDTVDGFVAACDFFTLDVAKWIGVAPTAGAVAAFTARCAPYEGRLELPGLPRPLDVSHAMVEAIARQYLAAVGEAGEVYRRIRQAKGTDAFVVEISMDETGLRQSPVELLFILSAVAAQGIPVNTIAPRFSGRFNKGVDYVGDVARFDAEFRADLAVVKFAVERFGLPGDLKLSVHSGSDKFALYPLIHEALGDFDAGVHLKTAGTTWLAEITALAEAGGEGLAIARELYAGAHDRLDELCSPYADVIDIDRRRLPPVQAVMDWDGDAFARAVRHDQTCSEYNPHMRQLLHVAYKLAAELGDRYLDALTENETSVEREVTRNLYERHLVPLVLGR